MNKKVLIIITINMCIIFALMLGYIIFSSFSSEQEEKPISSDKEYYQINNEKYENDYIVINNQKIQKENNKYYLISDIDIKEKNISELNLIVQIYSGQNIVFQDEFVINESQKQTKFYLENYQHKTDNIAINYEVMSGKKKMEILDK